MEYIMLLHIRFEYDARTGGALKIHRVEEWLDSKYAAKFFSDEKKRIDARRRATKAATAAGPNSIERQAAPRLEMRAAKL